MALAYEAEIPKAEMTYLFIFREKIFTNEMSHSYGSKSFSPTPLWNQRSFGWVCLSQMKWIQDLSKVSQSKNWHLLVVLAKDSPGNTAQHCGNSTDGEHNWCRAFLRARTWKISDRCEAFEKPKYHRRCNSLGAGKEQKNNCYCFLPSSTWAVSI